MRLEHDAAADAAYINASEQEVDRTGRLDQDRAVDYDAAGRVVDYDFMNVRRHGVKLDDLEHREELRALVHEAGLSERTWSAPLSALRHVGRRRTAT